MVQVFLILISLNNVGMSVEKFSEICRQDGLEKLDTRYASSVCYDACVTPCSLIVALLYLDRLRTQNPDYLANTSPSQVFLVATVSVPSHRKRNFFLSFYQF